mgnify:CR=1 FL=1
MLRRPEPPKCDQCGKVTYVEPVRFDVPASYSETPVRVCGRKCEDEVARRCDRCVNQVERDGLRSVT